MQRAVVAAISLLLIALGVGTLLNCSLSYKNYWGGLVFAPFAILVGGLLLVVVIFKWHDFSETKSKGRIRGWPTGKARR